MVKQTLYAACNPVKDGLVDDHRLEVPVPCRPQAARGAYHSLQCKPK